MDFIKYHWSSKIFDEKHNIKKILEFTLTKWLLDNKVLPK